MISSNALPQKRLVSRVHITFVDASSNYFIKNSPHTPRSLPFRLARSRLQSASFSLVNCRSMLSLKVPSRSRRCVFCLSRGFLCLFITTVLKCRGEVDLSLFVLFSRLYFCCIVGAPVLTDGVVLSIPFFLWDNAYAKLWSYSWSSTLKLPDLRTVLCIRSVISLSRFNTGHQHMRSVEAYHRCFKFQVFKLRYEVCIHFLASSIVSDSQYKQ